MCHRSRQGRYQSISSRSRPSQSSRCRLLTTKERTDMKRCVFLFVLLFSVSVAAQQQPAAPKAPAPPSPPQPSATPTPPQPPAPQAPEPVGQPINIRLDVSVIDQIGAG